MHVNGASIELDEPTAALARKASGQLELGIRPMYLELASEPVQGGVEARIKLVEDQGSCKIVSLAVADTTLHARLPERQPVPSGQAWVVFPPQHIRLFDDGRRLV